MVKKESNLSSCRVPSCLHQLHAAGWEGGRVTSEATLGPKPKGGGPSAVMLSGGIAPLTQITLRSRMGN